MYILWLREDFILPLESLRGRTRGCNSGRVGKETKELVTIHVRSKIVRFVLKIAETAHDWSQTSTVAISVTTRFLNMFVTGFVNLLWDNTTQF